MDTDRPYRLRLRKVVKLDTWWGEAMKKALCCPLLSRGLALILAAGLACTSQVGCGGKSGAVERTTENGVEVVLNHLEPYIVRNGPARLQLVKEYVIDTESPDLLAAGLTDIRALDVDSRGNLYILQPPRNSELLVFRFGDRGHLEKSLVRKGTGPGEVQWPFSFGINSRDEVQVFDSGPGRLLSFNPSGDLLREIPFSQAAGRSIPFIALANGHFISSEEREAQGGAGAEISLTIFNEKYEKVKTFSRFLFMSNPERVGKINAYTPIPLLAITPDRIFLGYPGEIYEILAYDLEGNLLRKIRKDYRPVPVTEAYRKAVLARAPKGNPLVERLTFPDHKPAFQFLFVDENGRLYAMTSEIDGETGQDICDIFNRDGIFIGRTPIGYFDYLKALYEQTSLGVVAKNGRMYVLREKEDGFKELVVFRAVWR
jgi:hypothetical protein